VESQHVASTRRLVDSNDEQALLEEILERAKPKPPESTAGLDYLLATPFRYAPSWRGSRFRSAADPGVFYAAEERRTACAELGYWRWRFVTDSSGLTGLGPAAQTLFQLRVAGSAIDLRQKPFVRDAKKWTDPDDYSATQTFAAVARAAEVGVIRYESVRDPAKGGCAALLDAAAFAAPKPLAYQTWFLTVTSTAAAWHRDGEKFEFVWA
jgi:RES domain-containing protein